VLVPSGRSFFTKGWVRLFGLLRGVVSALFVTQLVGLLPLGLETVGGSDPSDL
jgi:hypothetical protein